MRPAVTSRAVRKDFIKIVRDAGPRYTQAAAARAHSYEAPVLIPWSREDRVLPYRLGEELARRFPNATLVPIDDSYTFSPEDNPERLVEVLGEFLAANPTGRAGSEAAERFLDRGRRRRRP